MALRISKIVKTSFYNRILNCKAVPLCGIQRAIKVRTIMTETPLTFLMGYKFMHKFDERSRIIVLDGSLAVGKTTLAKDLAEKLGMRYFPECHVHYLDNKVVGDSGKHDPRFTGDVSLDRFYADPLAKDGHTFRFQLIMYALRFIQYADVLKHLLETGQGVVMERSVYSDFVFLEAIMDMGWIRKECYDYYKEIKDLSIYRIRHPHAIVYLDAPPEVAHKRFIERGKGSEKTVTLEYFQALDKAYKDMYLPQMAEAGCEILEYDWQKFGSVDRIVDDLSFLKYEQSNWNLVSDTVLDKLYRFLSNDFRVANCMNIPKFVPEITYSGKQFSDLLEEYKLTCNKHFAEGYNPGDYKHFWELMFRR